MPFKPTSNVILTTNPSTDYNNILYFSNKTEQYNYFYSRRKKIAENYSYIRKDNVIKVPYNIDDLWDVNYIMYQNEAYNDKWFYAFITNKKYENNDVTSLTIETDVFQTWFFDVTFKPSFVVREHVADDTIGKHTVDENLNVGEVIQEKEMVDDAFDRYNYGYYVAIDTSWILGDDSDGSDPIKDNNGKQFDEITVYGSNVKGTTTVLIKINSINDLKYVGLYIMRCNSDEHIEDVQNIYIIPNAFVKEKDLIKHIAYAGEKTDKLKIEFYTLEMTQEPENYDTEYNKQYSFSTFSPKNKKCFVYPYNYLYVTNNQGNSNIYKYEDFTSEKMVFNTQSVLSIGGSCRIVPKSYKNMAMNYDESIPLGKLPTCGWSADSFTNWLTQNAINKPIDFALKATSIAASLALPPVAAAGGATLAARAATETRN